MRLISRGSNAFGDIDARAATGGTIFVADSLVHFRPDAEQLANIVIGAAAAARLMGHEPRVALLSYSTFRRSAA